MGQKHHILSYVVAYLIWFLTTIFGAIIINLGRETVLIAMVVASTKGDPTKSEQFYRSLQVAAISNWSIVAVGVLVIILMIALEHYFRTSAHVGTVWNLFFLVTGIELTVLFVIQVIYTALQLNFRPFGYLLVAVPAAEAILAALFFWLRAHQIRLPSILRT